MPWAMTKPSYRPRFSQTARAICIRSAAVRSVESSRISSHTVTAQTVSSAGSRRTSAPPVRVGDSPFAVSRHAIVPPVAIKSTLFIDCPPRVRGSLVAVRKNANDLLAAERTRVGAEQTAHGGGRVVRDLPEILRPDAVAG